MRNLTADEIELLKAAQQAYNSNNTSLASGLLDKLQITLGEHPALLYNRCLVRIKQRDYTRAKEDAIQTLEIFPKHGGALCALAEIELCLGNITAAMQQFKNAEQTLPNDPIVLQKYAKALMDRREMSTAISLLRRAHEANPDNADILAMLGDALYQSGDLPSAITEYKKAIELNPICITAHLGLGEISKILFEYENAVTYFRQALRIEPETMPAYIGLMQTYYNAGEYDNALTLLDEAEIAGLDIDMIQSLRAETLERAGKYEEALELLESVIQNNKTTTPALLTYAQICHRFDLCAKAVKLIEQRLSSSDCIGNDKQSLHYAAARIHDRVKNYDSAFAHYHAGNEDQKKSFTSYNISYKKMLENAYPAFDAQQMHAFADYMIRAFTADVISTLPVSSNTSEKPIFIVGMPRSGTSLTEQILASHQAVHGAGERGEIGALFSKIWQHQSYLDTNIADTIKRLQITELDALSQSYITVLDSLAPTASRVIDKMPHNFQYLPLIVLLFPKCRIIHCHRNPIDTTLSIYFQQFSSFHRYATDLEELGIYYQAYERLMAHWEKVLPKQIFTVNYEVLVNNQREVTERLLDFCGLEWDDQVLNFHRTKRTVTTASYNQVNQPLYTSSHQRWKNYSSHLRPLLDILKSD